MHEHRCVDDVETNDNRASFVLCRIFHKSSIGMEKMDQCGSCYTKEEWEDVHDSGESDTNSLEDADHSDQKTDVIFMAPGFRFRPTDEELVGYYLKRKVMGLHLRVDTIPEVNIYKSAPWDLPSLTRVSLTVPNKEGYFFCILDRKYSQNHSTLSNRATAEGYWKSTGYDCPILSHFRAKTLGMKKFLVFHTGRAPRGQRTDWVMHEYRLKEDEQNSVMCGKGSTFVVCKIFQKKSSGEQKGRPRSVDPFTEETDEGETIPGEVKDCASNLATDASPNVTLPVCTPNEAMFAPMVAKEKFAPKVTQAHAAQNAELMRIVQKKIHAQASKEVQQGKAESLYKVGSRVEIAYMHPGELRTVGNSQLLHSNNQDHKRKLSHSSGSKITITSEFTTTSDIENKNGKEIAIKSQYEVFQQFKRAKVEGDVKDPFGEEINEELILELGLPGYKGAKKNEDREKKDNRIPRTVDSSINVGLLSTLQENNKTLELLTSSDNSSKAGLSNPLTSSSDASLVESSTSSIKLRFDKLPLEQPSLPFEKHTSLWDTLENMEVFHIMPQNPHFAPLGKHGEDFREGMAIGLMLTFSNVVASIEKLDVTSSVEKLGLINKTLIELEAHGFEVQCLRARLVELLNVKGDEEKLDDVSGLEDLIRKNERVYLNLELGLAVKYDVSS